MIPPYFSEPTNDPEQPLWRWVQSILEASQNRKLRFEESWIISACDSPKQAKSLADVHANIQALLSGERVQVAKGRGKNKKMEWKYVRKPVSGMNAGIYTSLNAYFSIVMPQLKRLPYTKKLHIGPGLNVMDLREYSMEMQALVIRSVIEHVYLHERNVRVIIPEAQDFVPQGKNTPVKMACETLVRKGAALHNFMWLDSQDMAAVEKVMLRAVSILGCGVQGEMHEINRAIEHMLGGHITSGDIARLPIGHFYVRLPGGDVKKVYVQPAWMRSEVHARAIAMGQVPASSARAQLDEYKKERQADAETAPAEKEAEGYRVEGETGDAMNRIAFGPLNGNPEPEEAVWKEKYESLEKSYKALSENFELLKDAHDKMAANMSLRATAPVERSGFGTPALDMRAHPGDGEGALREQLGPGNGRLVEPHGIFTAQDLDELYLYVRHRAFNDGGYVLQALVERPTLDIVVKRVVIKADGDTIQGELAQLIADKFFDAPREFSVIRAEMVRRGFIDKKLGNVHVGKAIAGLVELGFLTNEATGYQAVPGMEINIREEA
jgi:hypothetical protein